MAGTRIALPYGGDGTGFDIDDLVKHVRASGREYIIVGGANVTYKEHEKPRSLDHWLRATKVKGSKRDVRQTTDQVVDDIIATGLFVRGRARCPDSSTNRTCNALQIVSAKSSKPTVSRIVVDTLSRDQMESLDLRKVAARIAKEFNHYRTKFSDDKYPEQPYQGFRKVFAKPADVRKEQIRDALRWKYGHWNKPNFPKTHTALIERITKSWKKVVESEPNTPAQKFEFLSESIEVAYISSAFITHLLFPAEVPIIDQHNFRAMNHFLGHKKSKAAPSNFQDVLNLKQFIVNVVKNWPQSGGKPPTERELDKFLMAFGRKLKPRRKRKRRI